MKQYKSFLIDSMYPQGNDHISHLSAKRNIIDSKGFVSSQEGNTLITCQVGTMTMNLEPLNHALVEEHFLNGIYMVCIYIYTVYNIWCTFIYIYIYGVYLYINMFFYIERFLKIRLFFVYIYVDMYCVYIYIYMCGCSLRTAVFLLRVLKDPYIHHFVTMPAMLRLCYHPLMELVHANHFVSLAGVGHLKGRAYGYRHLV